eukprot:CAMPEP_0183720454 /NCGR_PEP_ID=MMETSP0737-20130205/13065_1 /TAXON_ID=385413 /ORGANISM="Thalassiosira miniscula, Strain CCMP1093" /LENGTH=437 /DNA_ID=CAMNT_0025950319 /DNA_START=82 /DNA_END=1395 /DNA_ORIENTATION=+
MPTFPGHWAGISGSIEMNEDTNPMDAAVRELREETNLGELVDEYHGDGKSKKMLDLRKYMKQGLHVDVSSNRSKGEFGGRIIRVYPFALTLPGYSGPVNKEVIDETATSQTSSDLWSKLEMKGTEHDQMEWITIGDFLEMTEPCVPLLKLAFHHATSGSYLELPKEIRTWENDRVNGAAFLAKEAVKLAADHTNTNTGNELNAQNNDSGNNPTIPLSIAMLRSSMVPIVNIMNEFDRRVYSLGEDSKAVRDQLLESLGADAESCVERGVETILRYVTENPSCSTNREFVVGTFSRSSTMKSILRRVLGILEEQQTSSTSQLILKVLCSRSTPGDEGGLMASDIPDAECLADKLFMEQIKQGKIHLVLVGADCILPGGNGVVNKVGTASLARVCKQFNVPIVCCADKWKLWEDIYPPGLEDIFELVPSELLNRVIVGG